MSYFIIEQSQLKEINALLCRSGFCKLSKYSNKMGATLQGVRKNVFFCPVDKEIHYTVFLVF